MSNRGSHMQSSPSELEYRSYSYRWVILAIFCALDLCNAMLFVTFAPISNISQNYFGQGDYGTASAVNMLATVFLILYPIGTVIGIVYMKYYNLKSTLVFAGALNAGGALLRLIAALCHDSLGHSGTYILMLFGQCTSAMAYPMYVNLPAAIGSVWFPVNERDLATTAGALFNPIGNAFGQVIPTLIVHQDSQLPDGDDTGAKVYGMENLMLIEFLICLVPVVLAVLFFRDAPPTPPSHSTSLKIESVKRKEMNLHGKSTEEADEIIAWRAVWKETREMFRNRDFVILFVAFSINFGILNALLTVFNQLLSPHGYSNGDTGTIVAICIVVGLIGSVVAGYAMEKTQRYREILKVGCCICVVMAVFFLSMLYEDNFYALLVSAALLGFFALPMLPIMIENCVECTYPLPEELSIGVLHNGANVLAVFFVYITQALLTVESLGPAPFEPSSIFIAAIILVSCILTLFFNGQYKRLGNDLHAAQIQEPLLRPSEFNSDSVAIT